MAKDPIRQGYVSTPVFARLRAPKGAEEEAECLTLMYALRDMRVERADVLMLVDSPVPCVRVQYADAEMPEVWWSRWLWGRATTRQNRTWLLRLAGIIPSTRELYFIPLPDRLECEIATSAHRANDFLISAIHFGVILTTHGLVRQHYLCH